ncbi:gustatory receptor for bitter taste 22e-like [Rhagoletis pomonella]|uniref:gustatory receptor for bitter taste 22e-like n=1 Tax=Rhagoletis pomonella TaxID=28610 RepID=UPI001784B631|nr:gustatory receptor for bitter taste 22e-like [Rhagoletis pomonella]
MHGVNTYRLRKRISRVLIKATFVLSICFGLLPFYYNQQQKRFTTSKSITIYNIFINILFASIMVFVLQIFSNAEDPFQTRDPLAELLNQMVTYASFCAILITWWINWTGRKELQKLFNEFAAIDADYCYRYPNLVNECAHFDSYLIWKGASILLQNASAFANMWLLVDAGWLFILCICLATVLTNVLFLVMTHFFIAVLYTYRFAWVSNMRLQIMADSGNEVQQRAQCRLVSLEIDAIAHTYLRLIRLCEGYTKIHQYQLLLVVGCITACNIEVLFYMRLLWGGKAYEMDASNIFGIIQIFFVNILDFWLTMTICELAVVTSQKTLQILRVFNEKWDLAVPVERSLERFALICCSKKLRFHLCGIFDINHLTGLQVLFTMILYLIYLVQYYHDNL